MKRAAAECVFVACRVAFALSISIAVIPASLLMADLAPPGGYRAVKVCHTLQTSRHGEIVLLGGLSRSPVDQNWAGYNLQEVPVGQCLPSSYRAQYSIFAVTVAEWEKVSSANGKAGPSARQLDGTFGSPAGIFTDRYGDGEVRVTDADPLQDRTVEWAVAGLRGKNPVLYVKRIVDHVKVDGGELQELVSEFDPPASLSK